MTQRTKFTAYGKAALLSLLYDDVAGGRYYATYGRYTAWDDADAPPQPNSSVSSEFYSPAREVLYGKEVRQADCRFMVDRTDWTSNTVYTAYDDQADCQDCHFFVATDERKVYKCLFNSGDSPSTTKPTLTSTVPFATGDGYVWKYMFTVPAADLVHATSSLYPISPNTSVEAAAVNGAIDVVLVQYGGNNWSAIDSGAVTGVVSTQTFRVSNTAPIANDLFRDSAFYVTSGPGTGSLSRIDSSVTNSSGIFVRTTQALGSVAFGSGYTIAPCVNVIGDGTGCVAVAVVNASSKVLEAIQVVNSGSGYTRAQVTVGASQSNAGLSVRAVLPPPGGHGSDPRSELLSESLSVVVKTSNVDSFSTAVDFRRVALAVDPRDPSGDPFTGNEFRGTWTATCNLVSGSVTAFAEDETIVGQTSGATASVVRANTTWVEFGDLQGAAANGETFRGANTGSYGQLTGINSPEVDAASGRTLFVLCTDRVLRSNSSIEYSRFRVTV